MDDHSKLLPLFTCWKAAQLSDLDLKQSLWHLGYQHSWKVDFLIESDDMPFETFARHLCGCFVGVWMENRRRCLPMCYSAARAVPTALMKDNADATTGVEISEDAKEETEEEKEEDEIYWTCGSTGAAILERRKTIENVLADFVQEEADDKDKGTQVENIVAEFENDEAADKANILDFVADISYTLRCSVADLTYGDVLCNSTKVEFFDLSKDDVDLVDIYEHCDWGSGQEITTPAKTRPRWADFANADDETSDDKYAIFPWVPPFPAVQSGTIGKDDCVIAPHAIAKDFQSKIKDPTEMHEKTSCE